MRWLRVLLILGAVLGAITFVIGALGLAGGLTDSSLSPSDRNDTVLGAIFFMVVGLIFLVPCLVVLIVVRPGRKPIPAWQPGSYYLAPPPAPPGAMPQTFAVQVQPALGDSYLQWFGWCQREIGGDAIVLHSATMAALARAAAGDTAGAQVAARQAAGIPTATAAGPPKVSGSKVKVLSRIAAGTLPVLEPGERVLVSLYTTDRQAQMWQIGFGLIGYLIAASQLGAYYLTVTDRRLIALTGPQLAQTPQAIAFIVARAMITQATYRRGWLSGALSLSRVTGERNRFVVRRQWRSEAAYAHQLLAPGTLATPIPTL